MRAAQLLLSGRFGLAGLYLALTICPLDVATAEPVPVLIPQQQAFIAGSRGSVWVCYLNDSNHQSTWTFAPRLNGTFVTGSQTFSVVLVSNTNGPVSANVAPGNFVKQEYWLDIPSSAAGTTRLEVSNYTPIVVQIQSAPIAENSSQTGQTKALTETNATTGAMIVHFLGEHISVYEPIYFLLGTYPAAEFQFSLKYKVFTTTGPWNPFAHLYFAYTQTSFWDLLTRDPSFFDTSYKPSVFLLYSNILEQAAFRLDLQSGAEHESNGRGGSAERSLYTAYLQPTARLAFLENFEFAVQPRAWTYLSLGVNNPDLAEFRGYADLRTSLTWTYNEERKRMQLANQFRLGDDGRHPGVLLDLRIDLPSSIKLNPTLQFQYFTGYGQTLRQYNVYSHGFRAGLCLHY